VNRLSLFLRLCVIAGGLGLGAGCATHASIHEEMLAGTWAGETVERDGTFGPRATFLLDRDKGWASLKVGGGALAGPVGRVEEALLTVGGQALEYWFEPGPVLVVRPVAVDVLLVLGVARDSTFRLRREGATRPRGPAQGGAGRAGAGTGPGPGRGTGKGTVTGTGG